MSDSANNSNNHPHKNQAVATMDPAVVMVQVQDHTKSKPPHIDVLVRLNPQHGTFVRILDLVRAGTLLQHKQYPLALCDLTALATTLLASLHMHHDLLPPTVNLAAAPCKYDLAKLVEQLSTEIIEDAKRSKGANGFQGKVISPGD